MNNGPELWSLMLQQFPPGAVVAGGAVRDYLLGVEPKDIDIFMGDYPDAPPVNENTDVFVIGSFDPRYGLDRIDNRYERQEEYAAMNNIVVISTGTLMGFRVDLIEMTEFSSGEKLVEGFDFGLTRCWFDGTIHSAQEATKDRVNKTVTLLLNDRLERSRLRFARFNERMGGDWRLVEPELVA